MDNEIREHVKGAIERGLTEEVAFNEYVREPWHQLRTAYRNEWLKQVGAEPVQREPEKDEKSDQPESETKK